MKYAGKRSLLQAMICYRDRLIGGEPLSYLFDRGFTQETIDHFQLGWTGDSPLADHPANRISIPSLTVGDLPTFMSFRAIDPDIKPKYLHVRGESRLFNPRAVIEAGNEIHITEGQLDAVILEQCGMHAVGVPGANAWKSHHARVFAGFTRVFVWCDNDTPGKEFGNTVCDSLQQAVKVFVGEAKDVNELYLAKGEAGIMEALRDE